MKTLLTIIIAIYTYSLSNELAAQSTSKWEFGIAAGLGRTYYDRKYDDFSFDFSKVPHFQSNYDWCAGIFSEWHFNRRFSMLSQLVYQQTDILPDVFSQWYGKGFWYAEETHHHGRAEAGVRWYINPRSRFIFFIETKAGADMFFAATDRPFFEEKVTNQDAFGYDRILPVASAAAGIKWRRFGLMADYGHDLLRAHRESPLYFDSLGKKQEY
ncbi:MAG: hypothetical protein BGO21_13500 [Dyadobacter sp. 50-39]|uniref:hypothetical protein n=1 Tax=Dyadobacter sp. 50-39 TaxID=1895756 RepID=UPI00095B511F|nr:hypothetical protein [Dyadobacter sp. 50-39]OJV17476.1 MAG: hypothetical protein BGO21_13500 [Dyadobacter sp. 50-39]